MSKINKEIFKFSIKLEHSIRLKNLLNYDFSLVKKKPLLKNSFKDDLLIRLAKRNVELENLPYGLSAMPSIKSLSRSYIDSFKDLYVFEDLSNDSSFSNILQKIYNRHADTSERVTDGLKELNIHLSDKYDEDIFCFLKKNGHLPSGSFKKLNDSIDEFFKNRFSVRLLIDQYLNFDNENKDYVGIINKRTKPVNIIKDVIEDTISLSNINYSEAPDINLEIISDPEISYIPSYLYYVLFEILKNSIRASVENNCEPVNIIISGDKDVTIKISDQGKGIKYSDIDKIWFYSYTSLPLNYYNSEINDQSKQMAGFGFGLPVSRATINFLGGDLKLMSLENYGTDVYLTLPKEN